MDDLSSGLFSLSPDVENARGIREQSSAHWEQDKPGVGTFLLEPQSGASHVLMH